MNPHSRKTRSGHTEAANHVYDILTLTGTVPCPWVPYPIPVSSCGSRIAALQEDPGRPKLCDGVHCPHYTCGEPYIGVRLHAPHTPEPLGRGREQVSSLEEEGL